MKNELQENSESAVAIIDDSQIKHFQSLYYLFKGKRDTDIKLFDDYKQFTYSDIIELNAKIYKKLELHEKLTDLVNVTVGLESQMVCKIDFVNAQICSELKTVVCEWYDALPKNSEEHKLIRFILKHEVKIQNIVVLSFLTAGIILINYLFSFLTKINFSALPTDPNQRLFLFLTSSIPLIYFFYRAGLLYADRIMKKRIGKLKRNPMFEFTKGDKNRFKEVADSNKKLLNQLGLNIFYALSANVVAYIIGLILKYMTNN
jgi:hypothetical protein